MVPVGTLVPPLAAMADRQTPLPEQTNKALFMLPTTLMKTFHNLNRFPLFFPPPDLIFSSMATR